MGLRYIITYVIFTSLGLLVLSGCTDSLSSGGPITLLLQEIPQTADIKANSFRLTITNVSTIPISLDLRVLQNPKVYCNIITDGAILLPSYGIPPTPRTTKNDDIYVLLPGDVITRTFNIRKGVIYDNLHKGRGAAYCWIRGGYSPYAAPDLSYPSEWTGCVYSNLVVFDAVK